MTAYYTAIIPQTKSVVNEIRHIPSNSRTAENDGISFFSREKCETNPVRQLRREGFPCTVNPASAASLSRQKRTPFRLETGFESCNYTAYLPICFATSSAKFSSRFSIPSPVSKRTNFLTARSLLTLAIYFATVVS